MDTKEKKALIEALLFVSGEPVTLKTLKNITELSEPDLRDLLNDLISEYQAKNGGLFIIEIANGYQIVTNSAYAEWLKKLKSTAAASKLSMPALETLAIIAYKQPIIKAEIEQIRSVNSDGVIKTLLDRRLIKIMGRKEAPGKPLLYGTTREFLQYFGLKDLTELPTIKELTREEAA
jgi:segregation and condensation protein B